MPYAIANYSVTRFTASGSDILVLRVLVLPCNVVISIFNIAKCPSLRLNLV